MTMAFNAAFNVGHLSAKARYGVMTLLYKKRAPRDLVNYRPLTITSLLYRTGNRRNACCGMSSTCTHNPGHRPQRSAQLPET